MDVSRSSKEHRHELEAARVLSAAKFPRSLESLG